MRTSRISRETARVVNALSSPRKTRSSLSLHVTDDNDVKPESPPSSQKLGKRKREPAETAAGDSGVPIRKARREPAKRVNGTVIPPPGWEKLYDATTSFRKQLSAPVDTQGCEALADPSRSPHDQRLQVLVSLMLSSQTKDTVTAAAMQNLHENLPGGFSLQSLLDVEPDELNRLIGKVGFHNNKTKYIKATALLLTEKFNSDIPTTIDDLISLPGVGPKMAYLCMSAAWGRDEGIGVDVHVHRITNLWGWHKTSNPEQTRMELESWLPKEKWHHINGLLVGLGQTICLPVGRKCGECELAAKGLCAGAVVKPENVVVKKEVEVKVKEEDGVVERGAGILEADDVGVKLEADVEGKGKIEVQGVQNSP